MRAAHAEVMPELLVTIREASRQLGIDNKIAGFLIRAHRIPTHIFPSNARAKGIDRAGYRRLAKAVEDWNAAKVSA